MKVVTDEQRQELLDHVRCIRTELAKITAISSDEMHVKNMIRTKLLVIGDMVEGLDEQSQALAEPVIEDER